MRCSIRNIDLPEPPRPATKICCDRRLYCDGKYTYKVEAVEPLNLTKPTLRPNLAKSEQRAKVVLDLARQGLTAKEIEERSGISKQTIMSTVMKYQEYGAKLSAPPKTQRKPPTVKKSGQCRTWKAEHAERTRALRKQGMTYKQIADTINVPQATIWNHREEFE